MDKLKVSELRDQLRQRGLSQKGTKRTLLRRLRAAMVNTDADSDATRPSSTNSLPCSTNSLRRADQFDNPAADRIEARGQPGDNSSVSSSVHSAQSGSTISESLFIKQAKAAAKRAGLEARMMLLAEKQRLTEEATAARQRELELELQQERLELEMEILDSAAREKEFGKFQVHFDNNICVGSSNTKPDAQVKIHPVVTRESKAVAVNISEEEGVACIVSRGQSTNVEDRGRQLLTKAELPAHIPVDYCNAATAPDYKLATAPLDTLTQMLKLTERNTLPRVEIEKFGGEVASYRSFIRAFEHLICTKVKNDDEKLYYLEQYISTGQPREIVRGCLHMPTESGYKEARRLFEARYGNQYKIAARSVDRILNWPPIKIEDIDAMDDFSIALRTCYNSMEDMLTGTSELDHPKTMRKILEKLPLNIQDRWRRLADDVSKQKKRIVAFRDLVDFVEREARIVTNSLFGRHLFSTARGQSDRQRSGPAKRYNLAANVGPADRGSQPMHCLWCKAMHPLDECAQFMKNPMDVKREFIRNNLICFGCLVQGHVAKNCKNRSICRQCKGKHATALHWPGTVEENRQRMSDTNEVIRNARVDISTRTSLAPSGMAIVPVKIRSKIGRCVETYAFLDNGSSASFCAESLCRKLQVYDAKPIELTQLFGHMESHL